MDKVWEFVRSPEFIVGGIVFGFLISVVANFATRALDRRLARYFHSRKQRSEKRNAERAKRVDSMTRNYEILTQYRHQEVRLTLALASLMILWAVLIAVITIFGLMTAANDFKELAESGMTNRVEVMLIILMILPAGMVVSLAQRISHLISDIGEAAEARRAPDNEP